MKNLFEKFIKIVISFVLPIIIGIIYKDILSKAIENALKEVSKNLLKYKPRCLNLKLKDWEKIYSDLKGQFISFPCNVEFRNTHILCKYLPSFRKKSAFILPEILVFDNIERKIDSSNIVFQLQEEQYKIPDEIKEVTEGVHKKTIECLKKNSLFYNWTNARLMRIIEEDGVIKLLVQPANYEDYVHTNLILDSKIRGHTKTLRQFILENHNYKPIENINKSPLANLLGIDILLFTSGGSLIMQRRSANVAFWPGKLVPTASGTVNWDDVNPKSLSGSGHSKNKEITLENMPKLRELKEEIGIDPKCVSGITFLGITLELIRGTQPEMFFSGKVNHSQQDINELREGAKDKKESREIIFFGFGPKLAFENLTTEEDKREFCNKIQEFLCQYGNIASYPLLTAIALWVRYRIKDS